MMRMRIHYTKLGSVRYAVQDTYRALYALFSFLMFYGFFTILGEEGALNGTLLFPALLLLLSLAGLGYRESWNFDPSARTVRYTTGWLFLTYHREDSFEQIERLEISHFLRGHLNLSQQSQPANPKGRNKAMVVFSLMLTDGRSKDIEIIAERISGGKTEQAALAIATHCGFAYTKDRDADSIEQVTVRDL